MSRALGVNSVPKRANPAGSDDNDAADRAVGDVLVQADAGPHFELADLA